jgi:hypothetical protein
VSRLFQLPLKVPGDPEIEKNRDKNPQEEEQIGKPRKTQCDVDIPGKIGPSRSRHNDGPSSQ